MQNGLARVIFHDDSIRNLTKRLQKNYQLVRIVVDMRLYGGIFQSAAGSRAQLFRASRTANRLFKFFFYLIVTENEN